MENLGAALETGRGRRRDDGARHKLEEKISEEYVLLRKELGEL